MVKVDIAKVNMIIKNNNLSRTDFCEGLGHSPSWYGHLKKDGVITVVDAIAIKSVYGVDVELKEENNPAKAFSEDNLEEVNQWLCEITAKLDEISEFKELGDKLSMIIDGLEKMANLQVEILSELKNIPKGVVVTKKPEKYTGKGSDFKAIK